jgi:N-acetyl-gamma-glutamyl-phosphate reductase
MIQAGIFGASGYTGYELAKILRQHSEVTIRFATSQSLAGKLLNSLYPAGPDLPLIRPADAPLDEVDVVFLCLPHSTAAPVAVEALNKGARVIDLSADFRLKDAGVYAHWYGNQHPAPSLLSEAVYGLTEYARDELSQTRLVANPGCYATCVLLAVLPVLQADIINGKIIADSKSGVSGAGRMPKANTHFVQVDGNFSPYKIGRSHRHLPEIEQGLSMWHENPPVVIFSPHLLPVPRGILSTIYVPIKDGWTLSGLRDLYLQAYDGQPFVQILPDGELATLAHANYSNHCVIGLNLAAGTLILTSAIDNLLKGAAGQAVQNMNLMFGLKETAGLP